MVDPHPERDADWAALSSMADGEASPDAQEHCLALWAGDAQARARWRDYQMIGDVLRSQELARDGAHDAAFLHALRDRLTREPVLLRPKQPSAAAVTPRSRAWGVPMAAVAGVAAVADLSRPRSDRNTVAAAARHPRRGTLVSGQNPQLRATMSGVNDG